MNQFMTWNALIAWMGKRQINEIYTILLLNMDRTSRKQIHMLLIFFLFALLSSFDAVIIHEQLPAAFLAYAFVMVMFPTC